MSKPSENSCAARSAGTRWSVRARTSSTASPAARPATTTRSARRTWPRDSRACAAKDSTGPPSSSARAPAAWPPARTRPSRPTRKYLEDKGVAADVVEVGCIGLCAAEPMLDVQMPGRARVSFGAVAEDKVAGILSSVFAGTVPAEGVLGQFRHDDGQALGRRGIPRRASVLRAADAVGAGQLRRHRPDADRGVHRARRLQGVRRTCCGRTRRRGLRRGREERPARARRRRFPDGNEVEVRPEDPRRPEVPHLQRRRGRPRRVHGPRRDRGRPAPAARRHGASRRTRIGATKAYVYIRAEYPLAIKRLVAAIEQAKELRPARPQHSRQRLRPRHRHQDGRGRVRLRRGDGADPQHRGQARHAAAPPAVPGGEGPVRAADRHQQRRDAREPAGARRQRLGVVRRGRHADEQGHEGLRAIGQGQPHGPGRGGDGHDAAARSSSTSAAASPTARSPRPCRSAAPRAAASRRSNFDIDDRLRVAQEGRRDDGLGRPGRHGREHVHGGRGEVLHGLHPARELRQVHPVPRGHQADARDPAVDHALRGETRRPPRRSTASRASCT